MERSFDSATRITLLGRLRRDPTSAAAWAEFVEHYGRKIYGWCRQHNLQESDAHDVTQEVLLRLATRMRDFAYDPSRSFRGWLKTLTNHAVCDFQAARARPGLGSGDSNVHDWLHSVEARVDLLRHLEEEFDRELLEEAMSRVRCRVEPHTWSAFRLLALEGRSGAEAAAELGMKVATAFVARSKVQKMIQDEIRKLEEPDDTPGAG